MPGIGAIVSPDLEGTFRAILTDAERAHEHQSCVMLLLQMPADGEPLPALADVSGPEAVRMTIEQSLDEREERLISVCVVDVSEPLGAAGDR